MGKVNRVKAITLSNTIVEEIIKTKSKNKRITMKKMAEKFNVDRRQVKLVIDRENKRNQLQPPFTQIRGYSNSDSDQQDDEPETDDGQINERNSNGDGGSSDYEQDDEYEMVNDQSVFNDDGGSKDNLDYEHHDQDEETEDGCNNGCNGNNGGEATTGFRDSMQTSDFVNNTSNFIIYVRNLENFHRQFVNSITEKNEEIRNIYNDLIANVEKNKQLEVELKEAMDENQILKKKNAVLQASQNGNKNQCGACNRKLVFTVCKMIVCRTCSDEIRGQLTVQAEPNGTKQRK